MAIEAVKEFFKRVGKDGEVREFNTSSATVELAAEALNVVPARIAKSLTFKDDDGCILIVTAGDVKIDNGKFKGEFLKKAKMLNAEEVFTFTGHQVGGVCPFAIKNRNVKVYLDKSMKRFDTVFPACGSSNSAIELTCDELFKYAEGIKWIDVCKGWE